MQTGDVFRVTILNAFWFGLFSLFTRSPQCQKMTMPASAIIETMIKPTANLFRRFCCLRSSSAKSNSSSSNLFIWPRIIPRLIASFSCVTRHRGCIAAYRGKLCYNPFKLWISSRRVEGGRKEQFAVGIDFYDQGRLPLCTCGFPDWMALGNGMAGASVVSSRVAGRGVCRINSHRGIDCLGRLRPLGRCFLRLRAEEDGEKLTSC